jgi:hypothetical protein
MKAKTLDRMFDAGEDITDHLDLSKARRVGNDAKRVNVDFSGLDGEVPGPGGAAVGGNAPVADQAMAGAGGFRREALGKRAMQTVELSPHGLRPLFIRHFPNVAGVDLSVGTSCEGSQFRASRLR